ncbi:hypothetical protein ACFVH0_15985 [Streptomyces sp. NPDC127117]
MSQFEQLQGNCIAIAAAEITAAQAPALRSISSRSHRLEPDRQNGR